MAVKLETSHARSAIMTANRRTDTQPELAVRRKLHAHGLRFRVDYPIRLERHRQIRPDIVFTRQRVALFVDGCWWHGCPEHGTKAATNADYWGPKIEENRARDRRQVAALEAEGWTAMRVWSHEHPDAVAERVVATLRSIKPPR
jgi:DNA mismatch endonuclease (patch repair protein)